MRVGIDSPIEDDGAELAALIADALAPSPVMTVHASGFVNARSIRLEYGRDDQAGFELWYDVAGLTREVLSRAGPGGDGSVLPALRDPVSDRSLRSSRVSLAPGSIVLVDGRFLLRDELQGCFDLVAHLDMSRAARLRRSPPDDAPLAIHAWDLYLAQCSPAGRADVVIRYDHPTRPALHPSA